MKAVVGQTEYLHSLMRMAQTRLPSLMEIGSRELESKDLCCFEANGMRKHCLPAYRSIVFLSPWQMIQCPTLSLKMLIVFPNICWIFLQY